MSFTMRQRTCVLRLFTCFTWGIFACALVAGEDSAGLDPRVRSGATLVLDFPDLPETLAHSRPQLIARIPANYDPKRRYPLFLWLNGGAGNPGLRTDLVNPDDYICISLPLFYDPGSHPTEGTEADRLIMQPGDHDVLWNGWKAMLDKLKTVVPNIKKREGVAAGFSNGGHALSLVVSFEEPAKGFQRYFRTFALIEGGLVFQTADFIEGRPFLLVGGDKSMGDTFTRVHAALRKLKVDADLILMKGYGHEFPTEFVPQVKEWIAAHVNPDRNSPVKWQTVDFSGPLSRKDGVGLAEFLKTQDFVAKAEAGKPLLIYCVSDADMEGKGKKKGTAPYEMCDAADERIFAFHAGTLWLPLAAEFFDCYKVDVSEVAPGENCQVNQGSAPVVIVMGVDRTPVLVLRGGGVKELPLLEAMKRMMSKEDRATLGAKITGLAPLLVKLKNVKKNLDIAMKVADKLGDAKKKPDEKKELKIKEAEDKVADLKKQYDDAMRAIIEAANAGSPAAP